MLQLSGTVFVGGIAGCSSTLGGSESDIQDTDGDGVIDSEDYAPRDPDVQREEQVKGDTPTETETETSTETVAPTPSPQFQDGFEDGSFDNDWSIIWLTANTNPLNDWSVDGEHPNTGSRSLHLHSNGDRNTIATNDRIVPLDDDFTFEYSYYTPDSNSRGIRAVAIDTDRNGSENSRISELGPSIKIGSAHRSPNADVHANFRCLGFERRFENVNIFPPNEYNHIRVERRGDLVRGFRNGTKIAEGEVDLSMVELDLSRNYRLMFVSSGGYGAESNIWLDDVSIDTNI